MRCLKICVMLWIAALRLAIKPYDTQNSFSEVLNFQKRKLYSQTWSNLWSCVLTWPLTEHTFSKRHHEDLPLPCHEDSTMEENSAQSKHCSKSSKSYIISPQRQKRNVFWDNNGFSRPANNAKSRSLMLRHGYLEFLGRFRSLRATIMKPRKHLTCRTVH